MKSTGVVLHEEGRLRWLNNMLSYGTAFAVALLKYALTTAIFKSVKVMSDGALGVRGP